MSDEIVVAGEKYISSKRAAQLSAYTQDYVGQLARSGAINAKRVSGLWYVSLDSLNNYKSKAEEYKPQFPPKDKAIPEIETLISFDGRDFVSAARASEITSYHQDYIGQLARAGRIESRQIGNRWFIHRDGVLAHRKEKDALLAAVQRESVGIPSKRSEEQAETLPNEAFFTYMRESKDLMPALSRGFGELEVKTSDDDVLKPKSDDPVNIIPINRLKRNYESFEQEAPHVRKSPRTGLYSGLLLAAGGIAAAIFIMLYLMPHSTVNATYASQAQNSEVASLSVVGLIANFAEAAERFLGHDIEYSKK